MMHRFILVRLLLVGSFLLVCHQGLLAGGTTGILKGKITDITSNEALPLVNVSVTGSGRGGVTDENGEYSIVGITPGTYTLRVSLLGYQTLDGKKVTIEADQTTVINFKLASEDIQLEGVTVEGQRPLVDITKTAGDQTYNRDKIEQLPNVKGAADVIALQAGVVKFGNQLFVRGGRANETQILVDGVAVNDVSGRSGTAGTSTANEQLQQLYSGTSSGGGALSVAANAIQSVSVASSGLDAEYGNAQSGVVNITTRSGSETFSGAVQYRTDGITSSGFNERYYSANIGGPEPITTHLLPSLGVDVPGKLSFFMSSTFDQSDGPYGFNTSDFYHPVKRKVQFAGFFGRVLNGAGFTFTDKQNNDFSFNTKLSYKIGDNDQFAFSYRANASSRHPITSGYSWTNLYDSTTSTVGLTTQNVLQWTHILGTNALLKGFISRLETERQTAVGTLDPSRYSSVTDTRLRDPNHDGFNDLSSSQGWSNSNTVVWNAKVDYNAQVHQLHFLKTGMEYYFEHIQSTAISFPLDPARKPSDGRGLYPEYGLARWVTNNLPSRGALYVQDNIEFPGINIHVGLRYDYLYLGRQVYDPSFVKRWYDVNGGNIPEWVDNFNPQDQSFESRSFLYAFTHGKFSPRLTIGYPVSERTVFYFNYGHFLQYPERDQLFHDPIRTSISGNYSGNPALKPQKTVQYEAGFDQLIFDDLSLGIRGYYKDVFDYATLDTKFSPDLYVNLDYASTRGFEVIITKQLKNRYSGSIGYTFQLAKGRSSDPFASQAQPNLAGLPRETRLDFDQQHTLNLFAGYRIGPNEDFKVFGLNINNWGVSVTWNFGSGFPYTPYNLGRTLADIYLKNTGNGPYTSELNIALYKGFSFFDHLNTIFTLDITNVLNRRNVDLNAGGFSTLFGRPLVYGDYTPDSRRIYSWGGRLEEESFVSRVPPFVFKPPRQVSLGMKINWD